ncbi:hypothetical protein [Salinimicrobium sp. HB62]|uniref:hypothetical protein n=1 Tax=Salinimicrobium sp. HB62 TaxID=3077781 RepID=UPI002D792AB8|nr:hypothetical protein [Salinimicrobium sp. HB62]
MKTFLLTTFTVFFCVSGFAQINESVYPDLIGQNLQAIENNPDWKILHKASGDLNKDGFDDYALILESKDSIFEKRCADCSLLKNKPRIILILLDKKENEEVIIQNNEFIARGDEGGMAIYLEPELSIKDGLLKILYQYTRATQSYTFEFLNNQLQLIYAEDGGVHSASGNFENNYYDFKEGTITTKTGNISQDHIKTEVTKINITPKLLSEFGRMYEWEVIEYKYL